MGAYIVRRAFTLTELLTVIGIVAVVLAIALPVVVQTRRGAVASACSNNLRQLGMAVLMYAQDFDGAYPPVSLSVFTSDSLTQSTTALTWNDLLTPYLKGSITACPAREVSDRYAMSNIAYGYAYNTWLNKHVALSTGEYLEGRHEAETNILSQTVSILDARAGIVAISQCDVEPYQEGKHGRIYSVVMEKEIKAQVPGSIRHNGGANYAFLDGHVKWHHPVDFVTKCDGVKPCFKP